MRKLHFSFAAILSILLVGSACKPKPSDDITPFDKGSLLTNFSTNLIAPALEDYAHAIADLEADFNVFKANRISSNLEAVKTTWKEAYLKWQHVKPFDFGPIRDNGLKSATSTFPADISKISNNIQSGSYTLSSASNVDAIGFGALDYLLFRPDALNMFINDESTTTYTFELIQKLKSEIDIVNNAWSGYSSQFIASTGTETTSAFSELINEFNRDYELAKNAKLGIPMGKQSLGVSLPEYIEARYSGISFDLLRESIFALKEIYLGKTGMGFDDYLNHLERGDLTSSIETKFTSILSQIDNFSSTLDQAIQSNPAELDALYLTLSEQVVFLKTDMTSAFGVLITYQDNDGD